MITVAQMPGTNGNTQGLIIRQHLMHFKCIFFLDSSIRGKVIKLQKEFPNVAAAEDHFDISYANGIKYIPKPLPFDAVLQSCGVLSESEASKLILSCFRTISSNQTKVSLLNSLFANTAENVGLNNCPDFIEQSVAGMQRLKENDKANLIYKFAKCFGTLRNDESGECLMPMNRMPFGLVAYQIEFFTTHNAKQVWNMPD